MSFPASGPAAVSMGSAQVSESLINEKFALGIWHVLSKWSSLTLAIQHHWGGPAGSDKRDWLAGAIAELFQENQDTDVYDVEDVLLQVMQDEFDLNVEDGSEMEVAERIMMLRKETNEGNFATVDELQRKWTERNGREESIAGVIQAAKQGEDEDDESEDEDDELDDGDDDIEMGEAPELVPATRERTPPEVDEDGFTKVARRKKK